MIQCLGFYHSKCIWSKEACSDLKKPSFLNCLMQRVTLTNINKFDLNAKNFWNRTSISIPRGCAVATGLFHSKSSMNGSSPWVESNLDYWCSPGVKRCIKNVWLTLSKVFSHHPHAVVLWVKAVKCVLKKRANQRLGTHCWFQSNGSSFPPPWEWAPGCTVILWKLLHHLRSSPTCLEM